MLQPGPTYYPENRSQTCSLDAFSSSCTLCLRLLRFDTLLALSDSFSFKRETAHEYDIQHKHVPGFQRIIVLINEVDQRITSWGFTWRRCNSESGGLTLLLQSEPQGRSPTPNWFFGISLGLQPLLICAACTSLHSHSFFKVWHPQRTVT